MKNFISKDWLIIADGENLSKNKLEKLSKNKKILVTGGIGYIGSHTVVQLINAGHEVVILEAADAIGTGISARNSEVIHAGMYYPADSLKAGLCVRGNRLLRDYLPAHSVDHKFTGKLIVATNAQEDAMLASIQGRAEANGVEGMRVLTAAEARALEPNLECTSALFSQSTGIIDSHTYMLALQGDAEANGVTKRADVVLQLEAQRRDLILRTWVQEMSRVRFIVLPRAHSSR